MPGDYSRFRYRASDNFSTLLRQQGRVELDSDSNEFAEILDRRFRAETVDIIGRATVPKETSDAFKITKQGAEWVIGRGRLYLDGLQVENHGDGSAVFDPVLAELHALDGIKYTAQPYLTHPPEVPVQGTHLFYLRAWSREVTHLERPDIREPALGVDTVTQMQTAWQVGLLPDVPDSTSCATVKDLTQWRSLVAPSPARLTTYAMGVEDSTDPCYLNPSGGYRGLENRLYRVEVHKGGALGEATLKWSRDNASVGAEVTSINVTRDVLTVSQTKWDRVLRFSIGDWIEITDDFREFSGLHGIMGKVKDVSDSDLTITLEAALQADPDDPPDPAGVFPTTGAGLLTDPERHTRVRRWDQKGKIFNVANDEVANVDSDAGVIQTVGSVSFEFVLEDGIVASVSLDSSGTDLRSGDYWLFAARTADARIEELVNAPPRGVHYHYCPLEIIYDDREKEDCRSKWPPDFGGDRCECSVCVDADGHNHETPGKYTIQQAVDKVKASGGRVCLAPGVYFLKRESINCSNAKSLEIVGCGMQTVLLYEGTGAAFDIGFSTGVRIQRIAIATVGESYTDRTEYARVYKETKGADTLAAVFATESKSGASVIAIHDSTAVCIDRCTLVQVRADVRADPVVSLAKLALNVRLTDSLLVGGTGIGSSHAKVAPWTLTAELDVSRNVFVCSQMAVCFDSHALHFLHNSIRDNTAVGCSKAAIVAVGIMLNDESSGSCFDIEGNLIHASGYGIAASVDNLSVLGNNISAGEKLPDGAGIFLAANLSKLDRVPAIERCFILQNRITGCSGYGIQIAAAVDSALIKQNFFENIGVAGIYTTGDGEIASLAMENNVFQNIGPKSANVKASFSARAFGIVLQRARAAVVADNSFRHIGDQTQGKIRCGALLIGACGDVEVIGNSAEDIGPEGAPGSDTTVFGVVHPVNTVRFDRNRVVGGNHVADGSTWFGLRMAAEAGLKPVKGVQVQTMTVAYNPSKAESKRKAASTKGQMTFNPATDHVLLTSGALKIFQNLKGRLIATQNEISGSSLCPLVAINAVEELVFHNNDVVREQPDAGAAMILLKPTGHCEVTGNRLSGSGKQAAMNIEGEKGVCIFTNNRVDYAFGNDGYILKIKSPTAIFTSNYVKDQKRNGRVNIEVSDKSWTVLGNIVAARAPALLINGQDLLSGTPWEPLNFYH